MRRALVPILVLLVVVVAGAYFFARASLASDLVRAHLEQQLATRVGQTVRIRSVSTSLFPRFTLDLSEVSIGSLEAVHLGSIHIGIGLRDLLSRTIADADVIVTGGRVSLPLPFPLVAASPGSPGSQTQASSTITVASVRVISFRDFVLAGANRTLRIDLEAALDGDRLEVRELTARADRTQLRATGIVSSLAKLEGQFDATSSPLDLDELIALASAFTSTSSATRSEPVRTVPMHLTVKLAAAEGQFASYGFTDLTSTLDITPTHVALAPLAVRTFAGRFNGRLNVDSDRQTPRLRLVGQLDRLDVEELLKASNSPGGITGSLSGTVSLNGEGSDTETLIRTSRGTITAAITDGRIPHLEMVRTIVLAFGKPSGAPPAGSGSAFSRLGGMFVLENGTLSSNDLSMMSRDFDMSGGGSLSIVSGAVDARTNVVLSEELTAQAGTDLRRYAQHDKRVIVPARISGTLQQPTVSPDLAAATRRAIENELKRRATSFLEGLFKKKQD